MENFSPAVSVIVPVFNAEKYLGVCLESILIQTFTDFEVIVVDDCSTDASLTVAENFFERFNGRLKIISLEENTGSGSIPRNIGLNFARGKYVYFVDDDDFIVDETLATLYSFAENSQADVVFMEKFFVCGEQPIDENLSPIDWKPDLSDENFMFESDDKTVRVRRFLDKHFFCSPWSKFLRREFLVENSIVLPSMKISDDILWTLKIVCLAEKILRIPSRLYVHRDNKKSVSRRKRAPEQAIKFWISPLITVVEDLEKFMNSLEFFRQDADLRLQMMMFLVNMLFEDMETFLTQLKPAEVCEIILKEFSAAGSTHAALISTLIVMTNIYKQSPKAKENS